MKISGAYGQAPLDQVGLWQRMVVGQFAEFWIVGLPLVEKMEFDRLYFAQEIYLSPGDSVNCLLDGPCRGLLTPRKLVLAMIPSQG